MSCAARLPVFVLFGLAFFGANADFVIWGLYGLGIVVAILVGALLSRTLFRRVDGDGAFLIELPAYHVPSLKSLRGHVSHQVGEFVRNAGTVILLASAVIWFLLYMPPGRMDLSESWFGRVSAAVAPVFEPAGFGSWETTGALVSGLVAKEVVVSTMSQIYIGDEVPDTIKPAPSLIEDIGWILTGFVEATVRSLQTLVDVLTPGLTLFPSEETSVTGSAGLGLRLQSVFSPLSALAFMVFVLLYIPCFATLGAMRAEFGGRWAVFSAFTQLALAWVMAVLVFQGGQLLGFA
jgi:ferrous iron transport protein B